MFPVKGKGKNCLNHLKLEKDISSRDRNIEKGKEQKGRIKMHRVVRNWKVSLEDTVRAE